MFIGNLLYEGRDYFFDISVNRSGDSSQLVLFVYGTEDDSDVDDYVDEIKTALQGVSGVSSVSIEKKTLTGTPV